MKEQLEFSNAPWELRHCCNCDLCYRSLFPTKTFLKMSFLLKIMLPRPFSALENIMPYCHEAHCPSRLRRSFNVKFSRKIWERWRQQHQSTTENIWYPKKATVFAVSPSSSWQWGLLQGEDHETGWAALAGTGCGQTDWCGCTRSPRSCLHTEDC